jgi:hypothetical protein
VDANELNDLTAFAFFLVLFQALGVALLFGVAWLMRREIAERINRFKNRGAG